MLRSWGDPPLPLYATEEEEGREEEEGEESLFMANVVNNEEEVVAAAVVEEGLFKAGKSMEGSSVDSVSRAEC